METKKGETVSIMRERIIAESIKNLQNEGLKFSVDTLAEKLKISKKLMITLIAVGVSIDLLQIILIRVLSNWWISLLV